MTEAVALRQKIHDVSLETCGAKGNPVWIDTWMQTRCSKHSHENT